MNADHAVIDDFRGPPLQPAVNTKTACNKFVAWMDRDHKLAPAPAVTRCCAVLPPHCVASVSRSVCPVPQIEILSKEESRKTFNLVRTQRWTRVTMGTNLRSKSHCQLVTGNESVKSFFLRCAYLRQRWIDLRQTKTKMIIGPFYTIISSKLQNVRPPSEFKARGDFCLYFGKGFHPSTSNIVGYGVVP